MPAPFSPRVEDPGWLARVTAWIDRSLDERDRIRLSELRPRHIRPWSILMTVAGTAA